MRFRFSTKMAVRFLPIMQVELIKSRVKHIPTLASNGISSLLELDLSFSVSKLLMKQFYLNASNYQMLRQKVKKLSVVLEVLGQVAHHDRVFVAIVISISSVDVARWRIVHRRWLLSEISSMRIVVCVSTAVVGSSRRKTRGVRRITSVACRIWDLWAREGLSSRDVLDFGSQSVVFLRLSHDDLLLEG